MERNNTFEFIKMGQYSKYRLYKKMAWDGSQWVETVPVEYGAYLVEEEATECGYDAMYKWEYEDEICSDEISDYSYSAVVTSYTLCLDGDLYQRDEIGFYDIDDNLLRTVELDTLIESGSTQCGELDERYVASEEKVCVGTDLYVKEYQWVSYDGVNWEQTGVWRLSDEPIATGVTECGDPDCATRFAFENGVDALYVEHLCLPCQQYKEYRNATGITAGTCLESVTYDPCITSRALREFVFSTGMSRVTNGAFYGATNLSAVTMNDSITAIGVSAFKGCTSLTALTLPNTITEIGDYAFNGCTGFRTFTIPSSVTSIGRLVFSGCSNLTEMTYNGTESQWNAIEKNADWDRGMPQIWLHCTDGDILIGTITNY